MRCFALLLLCFIMQNCVYDYFDSRMIIENDSDKPIAYAFSVDTLDRLHSEITYYRSTLLYPKDYRREIIPGKNAWESYINGGNSKKLTVLFYDSVTLYKYSNMDTINKNKEYLKRIELSIGMLDSLNWHIIYSEGNDLITIPNQ